MRADDGIGENRSRAISCTYIQVWTCQCECVEWGYSSVRKSLAVRCDWDIFDMVLRFEHKGGLGKEYETCEGLLHCMPSRCTVRVHVQCIAWIFR